MKLIITTSLAILLLLPEFFRLHDEHDEQRNSIDPDSIVTFARTFLGTPYRFGGNTPEGFDCSGFVSFVFGHFNYPLPRSSADYVSVGTIVSQDSCQKGDIILFSGTNNDLSKIGHVGIVISDRGEMLSFIHASSSNNHRGIIISELKGTGYVNRFIGLKRLPCLKSQISD